MNVHREKTSESEHRSNSGEVTHEGGSLSTTDQFKDSRPQTEAHKSLQLQIAQSPRAKVAAQLKVMMNENSARWPNLIQKKENKTGLSDNLKSGIESLSGMSMDHVQVHYNSARPAQLNAHAYAQGSDIHVAPGQEQHLPHEAWHVVQQAQGRVKPTLQMKTSAPGKNTQVSIGMPRGGVAQLATKITHTTGTFEIGKARTLSLGETMEAILDPLDPVKGSEVSDSGEEKVLKEKVCQTEKETNTLDRTHLLHYSLGGFGLNANLYPMTAFANREHARKVESKVQNALFVTLKEDEDRSVLYKVSVDAPGGRNMRGLASSAGTTFNCKAQLINKKTNEPSLPFVDEKITSKLSNNPKPPKKDIHQYDEKEKEAWGFGDFDSRLTDARWGHTNADGSNRTGKASSSGKSWEGYLADKKISVKHGRGALDRMFGKSGGGAAAATHSISTGTGMGGLPLAPSPELKQAGPSSSPSFLGGDEKSMSESVALIKKRWPDSAIDVEIANQIAKLWKKVEAFKVKPTVKEELRKVLSGEAADKIYTCKAVGERFATFAHEAGPCDAQGFVEDAYDYAFHTIAMRLDWLEERFIEMAYAEDDGHGEVNDDIDGDAQVSDE